MKEIRVGLAGLGTVGTGVYKILKDHADLVEARLGVPIRIVRIADKDPKRDRGIRLPPGILVTDLKRLVDDPRIDVIVELIGGEGAAKALLLLAIARGKHIVTANKALLAVHGEEIFSAALKKGVDIGFEGSVGGGIPVLRALKEGLSGDRIGAIYGIINGTSNYILTKMTDEGKNFEEELREAQRLGYAEADPSLDIEGTDSAHKLAILAMLAFGTPVDLKEIYTEGISRVTPMDIRFADDFGYRIKLLAIAKRSGKGADVEIEARVHPTMIHKEYLLAQVSGVFNAVYLVGDAVGNQLFYGRGAGSLPTASAVVSDLIEIGRNILYAVRDPRAIRRRSNGRVPPTGTLPSWRRPLPIRRMEEIEMLYYLRFMAEDSPGVLSKISGILGEHRISISSVIQQGRKAGGSVPVVMMTHRARERDVRQALSKIDRMPFVSEPTMLIRVEGGHEAEGEVR